MMGEIGKILRVIFTSGGKTKPSKNLSSAIRRLDNESDKIKRRALEQSNSHVLAKMLERLENDS